MVTGDRSCWRHSGAVAGMDARIDAKERFEGSPRDGVESSQLQMKNHCSSAVDCVPIMTRRSSSAVLIISDVEMRLGQCEGKGKAKRKGTNK